MFVCNVKFNKNAFVKGILAFFAIVCICISIVAGFKIFKGTSRETFENLECLPNTDIAIIRDEDYTNILKAVNDNLDTYIGQKICYTGYVYRVSDIQENEFILARDMCISDSPKQTVVVGFLCKCASAQEFENNSWVTITGTIEKGEYLGEVPIINISNIERTSKPDNAEVPLPDDYYVPTSVIY
jgi:uncharacterized membrane protein YcgQ (UPF0703/DUF1980 family)